METAQWTVIGPFEVVGGARDAVVIRSICYIATYESEKFDFGVY